MKDVIKGFAVGVAGLLLMIAGAFAHEGDIQRQCAKTGHSNAATWRGELVCHPAKAANNQVNRTEPRQR